MKWTAANLQNGLSKTQEPPYFMCWRKESTSMQRSVNGLTIRKLFAWVIWMNKGCHWDRNCSGTSGQMYTDFISNGEVVCVFFSVPFESPDFRRQFPTLNFFEFIYEMAIPFAQNVTNVEYGICVRLFLTKTTDPFATCEREGDSEWTLVMQPNESHQSEKLCLRHRFNEIGVTTHILVHIRLRCEQTLWHRFD